MKPIVERAQPSTSAYRASGLVHQGTADLARRPRAVTQFPKRPFDEVWYQPVSSANRVTVRQSLELALPTRCCRSSLRICRPEADAGQGIFVANPFVTEAGRQNVSFGRGHDHDRKNPCGHPLFQKPWKSHQLRPTGHPVT